MDGNGRERRWEGGEMDERDEGEGEREGCRVAGAE